MARQHHSIKILAPICRENTRTTLLTLNAYNRRFQVGVRNMLQQLLNIMFRTTCDGEPLRTVHHLNQPMVMAKANHGGNWKLQHLVCRATPYATEHG